jgi:hypothetical protein
MSASRRVPSRAFVVTSLAFSGSVKCEAISVEIPLPHPPPAILLPAAQQRLYPSCLLETTNSRSADGSLVRLLGSIVNTLVSHAPIDCLCKRNTVAIRMLDHHDLYFLADHGLTWINANLTENCDLILETIHRQGTLPNSVWYQTTDFAKSFTATLASALVIATATSPLFG